MTKRTLLISEIFPPTNGGSGRWFWELYSRLPREEYVIAAGDSDSANAFDQTHNLNIKRLNLSSPSWGLVSLIGLKFYFRCFMALRRIIKAENIKAIHCGRCLPEGVMGLLLSKWFRIPFISYIHGEDIETASLSRELSLLVSLVLKSANTLICNSQNTANLVSEKWGIDTKNIVILNPGVDTERFTPAPYSEEARKAFGWDGKKVILTVGRLQRRKGHDKMIEAMPQILEQVPDAHYAIIGNGQERQRLQELAYQLQVQDAVQFLGEPDDKTLVTAYQQCDLFILPNRTEGADIEGFGMVLVEAQACGKPVIAGDSGGTKETMVVGETGWIIDCTLEHIIADTISEKLTNDAKLATTAINARKHALEKLDWKAHKTRAESIFNANPASTSAQ